jgi:hypothetical protein
MLGSMKVSVRSATVKILLYPTNRLLASQKKVPVQVLKTGTKVREIASFLGYFRARVTIILKVSIKVRGIYPLVNLELFLLHTLNSNFNQRI